MNFYCNVCKQEFPATIAEAISWQYLENKPKHDKDMHIFAFRCEKCFEKSVDNNESRGKLSL